MNEMLMLFLRALGHGQAKRRIAREEPHTEIGFDCPRCHRQLSAEVCDIDTRVKCTHCQKGIKVPELGIFPFESKRLSASHGSVNTPLKKAKGLDDYTADAVVGTARFFGRVVAKVSKRAAVGAVYAVVAPFRPKEVSFQRNGVLIGTFPFEDACSMLKSGQIRLTDLYFHDGMDFYEPVANSGLGTRLARERAGNVT